MKQKHKSKTSFRFICTFACGGSDQNPKENYKTVAILVILVWQGKSEKLLPSPYSFLSVHEKRSTNCACIFGPSLLSDIYFHSFDPCRNRMGKSALLNYSYSLDCLKHKERNDQGFYYQGRHHAWVYKLMRTDSHGVLLA